MAGAIKNLDLRRGREAGTYGELRNAMAQRIIEQTAKIDPQTAQKMANVYAQHASLNRPLKEKTLADFSDVDLVMEMLGRGYVVMPADAVKEKL